MLPKYQGRPKWEHWIVHKMRSFDTPNAMAAVYVNHRATKLFKAALGIHRSAFVQGARSIDGVLSGTVNNKELKHITVCICTFKRPALLERLLTELCNQQTAGRFTYSIVVVDNDQSESGRPVASRVATNAPIPIGYFVETRQNIALARNKALEQAHGDFVAFIDDDEFPTTHWLLTLFSTCADRGADGVLGPVKPYFDEKPPVWVVKSKLYERPSYPTGYVIDGSKGRTGNVLLNSRVFESCGEQPFRSEFLTGEDQDFFTRMIEKGFVFIWCQEAVAYEVVPPARWKRSFMLRRALLRGATTLVEPSFGARDVIKSMFAVPIYIVLLPLGFLLGQHRLMIYLVSLCDHLGKLLALVGVRPVKEPYVTS